MEVINAGIGGNNSENARARLEKDVLSREPDLVIMMFGTNDCLNSNNLVPLERYRETMVWMTRRIKESGAQLILCAMPDFNERALFLRHAPERYGYRPKERIAEERAIVREIAAAEGAFLLDAYAAFGPSDDSVESCFINLANSGDDDGVHPTAAGYCKFAQAVFKFLQENNLAPERIVCFGDSITAGAKMKTFSDSYPGQLSLHFSGTVL